VHLTEWLTDGRPSGSSKLVLASILLVGLASGCSGDSASEGGGPQPGPTSRSADDFSDAALWLSFDDDTVGVEGTTGYPDLEEGRFIGRVVTANGGTVARVPSADGEDFAVAFPAKCTATSGCPRAMIEVRNDLALNPGSRDFEFGATVWLAPDQTTTGSNIVQKGRFGSEGGQWKLQVDSEEGVPSCVVRAGTDILAVPSDVSISDSTWHRVVCRRDSTGVSIQVDDTLDRKDGRTGSVDNEMPVRVGAPGVGDDDDQFSGLLDDVFLRIEPS
jgi:hypothetical protein